MENKKLSPAAIELYKRLCKYWSPTETNGDNLHNEMPKRKVDPKTVEPISGIVKECLSPTAGGGINGDYEREHKNSRISQGDH